MESRKQQAVGPLLRRCCCAPVLVLSVSRSLTNLSSTIRAFSGFLDPHPNLISTPTSTRWLTPPADVVKINSDAAIFQESGNFGIGVIALDSQGQCLAWTAIRLHRTISPEVAEAWAVRITIQFAASHGWPRIVLEMDCATLHIKLEIVVQPLDLFSTIF
ncbi:UNVERIFIED_CONTAM: hypothetical protein Scaly_2565200 [Sesamum calycinum]|uniref:RNase H type-1 domain-containing protein n=1 Tax=Sesamum calycinum TaxID=2727403 RepID=A0AAW2K6S4_9LAMI